MIKSQYWSVRNEKAPDRDKPYRGLFRGDILIVLYGLLGVKKLWKTYEAKKETRKE